MFNDSLQVVAVTADFLITSINGTIKTTPISREWVGLVLFICNAAEHVTAVIVSLKDSEKLNRSIRVAVDSSIVSELFPNAPISEHAYFS